MSGPIVVDTSGSLQKVNLNIISAEKHSLLASDEYAVFQLTKRDIDFANLYDPMFFKEILIL